MKFPVLTKSRVGFSLALFSVMTLGGVELCRRVPYLHSRIATACVAVGLVGLLLWIKGQMDLTRSTGDARRSQDNPLTFLQSLRYWGFILATSAILVYFITPRPKVEAPPPTPIAKPVEPLPETNAPPLPPETNATPAVVFPPLKLSGLVYNGDNSTAVINGRTLKVGGYIGEVKLVAIQQRTATVELSGERKALSLDE